MSVGAQWAWDVLDKTARVFAVVAILAVSVGGVLLHEPAAVIGGVLAALAIFAFAEGTYRVASEGGMSGTAQQQDENAVWLSGQLSKGNALLTRWGKHASREVEMEAYKDAASWERETRDGLAARVPTQGGHFGVDVGLGPEWFRDHPGEMVERATFRRRIHRLAEIVERYERQSG
jgi:hypothetical protein